MKPCSLANPWKSLNSTYMCFCLFCNTVWFCFFSLWIKPYRATILWKATEQYVHVVFGLFYNAVWFCLFNLWIKPYSATILWKGTEQYFCKELRFVFQFLIHGIKT